MLFLLTFIRKNHELDLPDDSFDVDLPRTPFQTIAATTPLATESRYEQYQDVTVTTEPNYTEQNLLYAFIALVCVAVVGIIASVTYFVIKKRNAGQVAASANDQEEESGDGKQNTTRTRTMTMTGTRSMRQTIPSRTTTANTTMHAKSIYAVNTVIL